MKKNKLISLLRSFEKSELNAFDKFIQSPYFNSSEINIALWGHIRKYLKNIDSPQLSNEKTFKKVFPQEAYDDKRLRQSRSRLFKLVEVFLATQQFQSNEFLKKKKLKEAYYAREMYGQFESIGKALDKIIQKKSIKNDFDFHELVQLNHSFYFNQRSDKQVASRPHLEQSSKDLEKYYCLKKLKYACEWYSRQIRNSESIPPEISTFKLPKNHLKSGNPLFILYQNILSIFQQPIGKSKGTLLFKKTIELFKHHLPNIPTDDQIILLMYLLNYGMAGNRIQSQTFLNHLFDLYDLGIQQKFLFWKGELSMLTIINAVHLGCKLKKFAWAKRMLAENKQHIATLDKENFVKHALASIQFYQKKFKNAVSILENLKSDDLGIEMARRSLQLRSGFECFLQDKTYADFVENKAINFRLFLKRKKRISAIKRTAFLHLIAAILQAVSILNKNVVDKKALKLLAASIAEKEPFIEKDWLLTHLLK